MSSLQYLPAASHEALRQGEIIGPIWEHRPIYPPIFLRPGQPIPVRSEQHSLTLVLSPDCDLLWDYDVRFSVEVPEDDASNLPPDLHPTEVTHVLLCALNSHDMIRPRFKGLSDVWRRVENNQDERYHHLAGAPVAEGNGLHLHSMYLDFKKVLAVRTASLYDGVLSGGIERIARIPDVFVHDIVHRFYGFLSRVAVPE